MLQWVTLVYSINYLWTRAVVENQNQNRIRIMIPYLRASMDMVVRC
jgi:hypothetical protein